MACNTCAYTVCKDIYVHPCDTGINTGVILDTTGDYTIYITFNGVVQRYNIQVVAGRPIVLDNVLNAPYIHVMTIYDNEGNLVNDTCYKLNAMLAITPNTLIPNPTCCASKVITISERGDTVTDDFFALYEITTVTSGGATYFNPADFTQDGDTITFINGVQFIVGQQILVQA